MKRTNILFAGLLSMMTMLSSAANWHTKTIDWKQNPHPVIGDWGMNRPGYPRGLYIHGITVREGQPVRNAVIYDNDVFDDVFDDEWMYAMASLGRLRLVGQIVTPVLTDGWGFYHDDWVQTGLDAMERARQSGIDMTKIPPITVGTIAPSEKEGERKSSDAALTYVNIINKEYQKNPDMPVIINIGGQSASLASAWCIDPSIADKCIVYYTDLKVYNGHYEWASQIVAQNFRVISWGQDEAWWHSKQHQNQWNVLPRPEFPKAAQNDENSGEWRWLTEKHIPMLDHMVHQFRNRGEYSRSDGYKGDGYCDGTFMHAWLPGICGDAELQTERGGQVIHFTSFTTENEALVKKFALEALLNDEAYKHKNTTEGWLRVSDNGRFLQLKDDSPFFYLADTAWELFHRLSREEADEYLRDRASKGYTAIQAVALAELDGLHTPNAYGFLPLVDDDPTSPDVKDGPDNDYWDNVDYIVNRANELGLAIALLPTWGCHWKEGHIFNEQNARQYGRWIGERYRQAHIIWVLGGDRNAENEKDKGIIRAMAQGLHEGDGGQHLITYHPTGWRGSLEFFTEDSWISFHMRQNGHDNRYEPYAKTLDDYHQLTHKPVLDGEPIYEDHPIAFDPDRRGHSTAIDCRRALYWDLFNGACGHTYGHHSVWQMYDPKKHGPTNRPLLPWQQAIHQPAAGQMQWAKRLLLSRPYFTRIPATDEVLMPSDVPSAMPGQGVYRFAATSVTDLN